MPFLIGQRTLCAVDGRQPRGFLKIARSICSGDEQSSMSETSSSSDSKPQLLHLVFGGELETLEGHEFRDLDGLDIVGIYPDYQSAYAAWKNAAQRSVDNAMMRYFIVHLHRLLEPNGVKPSQQATSAS
jgi:hypothetical protein